MNLSKSLSLQPEGSFPSFYAAFSMERAFFPFFNAVMAKVYIAHPSIRTEELCLALEMLAFVNEVPKE
jgi:hypothetical protein